MTDKEGDGVALFSTEHPINITPEMIQAGIKAYLETEPMGGNVIAIYTAMARAEPPWPDDISDDALEDVEIEVAQACASEAMTRFEVIDERGRVYVRDQRTATFGPIQIELVYQDGGQTLKVFVKPRETTP